MNGNEIMFALFASIIAVFSVLTVTSRKILRAAVFLLFVLISTSGIYFMLNYQFLAAVQLTLYAGGIVVLIIFSILLTSHISQDMDVPSLMKKVYAAIASAAGAILCIVTVIRFNFIPSSQPSMDVNMNAIGKTMLSYGQDGYALPFEVISILLLAAMIAAIVVAKKIKTQ